MMFSFVYIALRVHIEDIVLEHIAYRKLYYAQLLAFYCCVFPVGDRPKELNVANAYIQVIERIHRPSVRCTMSTFIIFNLQ